MAISCDILIVGGGVIGASVAHALSQRRAGRVILLEKAYLGAGASGKSAAVIRQHFDHPLTAVMAQKGLRVYEHFDDLIGGPTIFTRTGMVMVVHARDRAGLEANLAMQRGLGIDVRLVTGQVLADIDANARVSDDEVAAFEAEAGTVDAVQVIASYAEAARDCGADVRLGVEVKSIVTEGGKVVGVETNEGRYGCRTLVLATGPWTAGLAKTAKVALPVQACRAQVALFRRPPDCGRRGAIYGDFAQGIYFKPAPGDLIHAGMLVVPGRPAEDPDHYDEAVKGDWLALVRQRLSRRYPAMHRAYGRGGYGALHAETPDGHPLLGRWPGPEGAFVAAGFGSHGFKMAPVVGQVMAELIVDGQTKVLDVTPLRPTRFDENEPVKTTHSYGGVG